jgi:hypothetical protein
MPPRQPGGCLEGLEGRAKNQPSPVSKADVYFRVEHQRTMVDALFHAGVMYKRRPHWRIHEDNYVPLERYQGRYYLLNHGRP